MASAYAKEGSHISMASQQKSSVWPDALYDFDIQRPKRKTDQSNPTKLTWFPALCTAKQSWAESISNKQIR